MTVKARKIIQISSEFRSRAGGRGREGLCHKQNGEAKLKLSASGDSADGAEPITGTFPINGRISYHLQDSNTSPLVSSSQMLSGRLCAPQGFPEHKFTADSIIKGRGKGRLVLPEHC